MLDSLQACDFLTQWPTLEALQQARPGQIRQLYREHGHPSPEQLDRRLEQIHQARSLTTDPAALLSGSMMVQALVQQLRPLLGAIERFDRQIAVIFGKHRDRPLFDSLPGAGAVLAPALGGGLWHGSGSFSVRPASATAVWHCAGHRAERQTALGALALGLSEVSAPDLPRVCRPFPPLVRLG